MAATLWDSIPTPWHQALISVKPDVDAIESSLRLRELAGVSVVPNRDQIFSALSIAPTDVSVVVIGQDPYPTQGNAIGLAFAVSRDTKVLPGSLRNILKEVESDIGKPTSTDCTLQSWVNQGVLLLNTSLTTELGVRSAHENLGWDPVVSAILQQVRQLNPKVVALLWGNHARRFADTFAPECVVESAHPSPLSAHRGFLGSKPFTRANVILRTNKRPLINW